jgi:hypothetical protein
MPDALPDATLPISRLGTGSTKAPITVEAGDCWAGDFSNTLCKLPKNADTFCLLKLVDRERLVASGTQTDKLGCLQKCPKPFVAGTCVLVPRGRDLYFVGHSKFVCKFAALFW